MAGALAGAILAASAAAHRIEWPSPKWRDDPVGFFRDVVGVEPWSKQAEIIEAVRDHKFVSVRAGQKVSKSHACAGLALWFYASFPDARVVMTSVTDRQVNRVLWRELRKMYARTGRCATCRKDEPRGPRPCPHSSELDGEIYDLARSGLKGPPPDFREIVGFTAKESEAVAGFSGANLLYIADEASGIADEVIEAMLGNCAGGGRVLLTGNPTRIEGYFYDTHHSKREHWKTLHVSSEDSPNVIQGREVIPGLAGREWVERMRGEWGEDSALYRIRVKGEFAALDEQRKVIQVSLVTDAEERWFDEDSLDTSGRLHVGVDCARYGDDDAAIAPRRGDRVLEVVTHQKLSEKKLAFEVLQVVRAHRKAGERKALVKVDACGTIGRTVAFELRAYEDEIEIVPVDVSRRSTLPNEYPLLRDQLWFAARGWLKEGGALPTDPKLAAELVAPRFSFDERGRRKVEPKDITRQTLKRSPDRADAVTLSIWEPSAHRADEPDDDQGAEGEPPPAAMDPYATAGADAHDSGIDPYRGVS
jgi:hypothetical protein